MKFLIQPCHQLMQEMTNNAKNTSENNGNTVNAVNSNETNSQIILFFLRHLKSVEISIPVIVIEKNDADKTSTDLN